MKDKNVSKETQELNLVSDWDMKFKDAMVVKADYTKRWDSYNEAYNGTFFTSKGRPDYKSNLVSNYIFSIIETIRPIMLDNNPKFQSIPRQPDGMKFSDDMQEALMYEWDREGMTRKLSRSLVDTLVTGNSVFFIPWNSFDKNVNIIPVSPFNIFPDPLSTCVEDAEYIIYASYVNINLLKRKFPSKINKLSGGMVKYSELVNNNDANSRLDNQVLVLEAWTYDGDTDDKGKLLYPNGRVITLAPELNLLLDDKSNPYNDGKLPFVVVKDYDVPFKFWGEGEVAQLISPQQEMNELNNSILDNAKATANMPWLVDKNSGIPHGQINSRPGLILRKNPGTEVRRVEAPNMPPYVVQAVETYKRDMEEVSGIFNTLKGQNSTGVYTAQGILALQEAGQVRIRLKVKLLEDSLSQIGMMQQSRMKQFWNEDRWIRITKFDGSYDLKNFTNKALQYDYDIKITAGSTMAVNRGAMLDLMVRLAQTQMPDGQPLVDREAVVEYLPEDVKGGLMKRMADKQATQEEFQQQTQQAIEQLGQQMAQIQQTSDANDEQIFSIIDEIANALEKIQSQTLQVADKHAKMEQDKVEEEKTSKIQKEAYNKGFQDSESIKEPKENEDKNTTGLPDDLLQGIEGMNDDELELLIKQNPQLLDLLK